MSQLGRSLKPLQSVRHYLKRVRIGSTLATRASKTVPRPPLPVLAALFMLVVCGRSLANQQAVVIKNPLEGDPKAIKQGYSLFRYNCALCHGSDARGGSKG